MPVAGIVTLIGVGLIVAALAVYLITVAFLLRRVSFNVGTVTAGLYAIAHQAQPLGQQLNRINTSLAASRDTLSQALQEIQRQQQARTASRQTPRETDEAGGETRTQSDGGSSAAAKSAGRKSTGRKSTGRKSTGRKSTGRKSTGRSSS